MKERVRDEECCMNEASKHAYCCQSAVSSSSSSVAVLFRWQKIQFPFIFCLVHVAYNPSQYYTNFPYVPNTHTHTHRHSQVVVLKLKRKSIINVWLFHNTKIQTCLIIRWSRRRRRRRHHHYPSADVLLSWRSRVAIVPSHPHYRNRKCVSNQNLSIDRNGWCNGTGVD